MELGIKIEQINKLRDRGEYREAARVCDSIDWRKVKRWSELSIAQDVYEKAERYKDSRNICVYAYNRNFGGKRLLFKLTELSIIIDDLEEADDLYREFVETAPRDMERYILLYKLNKARGASNERLIEILEEYKQNELDEQYEYELARLYGEVGRKDDCVRECDDLILWFNEGEYVEKALRLKSKYAELTKAQKAKLGMMEEFRAAGLEYESVIPSYENEPDLPEQEDEAENSEYRQDSEQEIHIPEKDYSIYDTQNVQAELAKSMAEIFSGMGMQTEGSKTEDSGTSESEDDDYYEESETDDASEDTGEGYDDEDSEYYSDAENYERQASYDDYAQDEEPSEYAEDIPEEEPRDDGAASLVESLNDDLPYPMEEPEDEPEYEDIDEPTKEIRVNTHHWKRYKSYMVEDEPAVQPESVEKPRWGKRRGLPKYLVETSETEGESVAGPEFIIEDMETIIGVEHEEEPDIMEEPDYIEDNYDEDVIDIAGEESAPAYIEEAETVPVEKDIEVTEPQEQIEIDEETELPEVTADDAIQESSDETDSEIISGQLDIMSWLGVAAAPEIVEPEPEPEITESEAEEPGTEKEEIEPEVTDTEPQDDEISEQLKDDAELSRMSDISELPETSEFEPDDDTDKSVEEAMDELTRRLMEEVSQDIESRDSQKKPSVVSEEEFVSTNAEPEGGEDDYEPVESDEMIAPDGPVEPEKMAASDESVEPEEMAAPDESVEPEELVEAVKEQLSEAEKEAAVTKESDYEAEESDNHVGEAEKSVGYDDDVKASDNYDSEPEEFDNPEDEGNDYVLKASERKYLRQYLFIDGLEEQAALLINSKKREKPDGTSARGNIVIIGKSRTDKKAFAIDLFKAIHAQDGAQSLRIARTTASTINHNGIKSCADKIKGMTLLIENAGQLTKASVNELCEFMAGDTRSMLVMMTGEDYSIKRLFAENPVFERMFDYSIEVRQYTVNEFVTMAKDYARAKGYIITDKALLKLYLMVDGLASKDNGTGIEGVRQIVDNAIERCRKKPKKSGALVKLKDRDFVK